MALLEVNDINSFYGDSHVLFDVSFHVSENEVVALFGRNGAGKTTTLKSLMGIVTPRSGRIVFDGKSLVGAPLSEVARAGMQWVPEERRIFGTLTVEENMRLASLTAEHPWPLDRIYGLFPRLRERRKSFGKTLSGGEQQMLAVARALVRDPKLILLDEPFEGLAPIIVEDLARACKALALDSGRPIVIVEQDIATVMELADRCYVIDRGHVVYDGTPRELGARRDLIDRYIGIGVPSAPVES
ncbi:MAG: ABC transporter ATP-binding protein [Rhodanobacteraceae bacterium]